MSKKMIRMSEDIDQIVSFLDGVAGSYGKDDYSPAGSRVGAASPFFTRLEDGQSHINKKFLELDDTLKTLAGIMRESVADQRAVEDEITDKINRLLVETETYSDKVNPNDLPVVSKGSADSPSATIPLPDGSPRP